MTFAVLALALQGPAEQVVPAAGRTVTISVTDEKGAPVAGLRPEEVVVLENGVARDVSRVEPESRPLQVAVIVDSSEPVSSVYRVSVVDEIVRFLGRLPDGCALHAVDHRRPSDQDRGSHRRRLEGGPGPQAGLPAGREHGVSTRSSRPRTT